MFTPEQKRRIAKVVEEVILEQKNSEMPTSKPKFHLHVEGMDKESSWADIVPNWEFDENRYR